MRAFSLLLGALLSLATLRAADKPLQIFFIDVEGGQATLFVPPHGDSLLIDTGWGYNAYRDANRIADSANHSGTLSVPNPHRVATLRAASRRQSRLGGRRARRVQLGCAPVRRSHLEGRYSRGAGRRREHAAVGLQ